MISMTVESFGGYVNFVYLGKKLPSYAISSLKIASHTSGARIRLIGNSSVAKDISKSHTDFIAIEDFYNKNHFLEASIRVANDSGFRNGFWVKSLERFFVLDQFAKQSAEKSIFHAELDQLLFGIDDLIVQIEKSSKRGMFLPFHSTTVAVASVVYLNDFSALDSLISAASTGDMFQNEMSLIGTWARLNPEKIFALPTFASVEKGTDKVLPKGVESLSQFDTLGVVDAAQLGQWVAGIDPRNLPFKSKPETKFVDKEAEWLLTETDLRGMNFYLSPNKKELYASNSKGSIRLYNLHLHSKVHKILLSPNFSIEKLISFANEQRKHRLRGTRTTQLIYVLDRLYHLLKSDPGRLKTEISWRINARLRLRKSSYPFVSGDTFRAISHHKWEKVSKQIELQKVNRGDIIFCESEFFQELCESVLSRLSERTVVILGNSDKNHDHDETTRLNSSNSPIIFAQNLAKDISTYNVLPIGIENAWRSKHGRLSLKKVRTSSKESVIYRVMWGFTLETNLKIRTEAMQALKSNSVADHIISVSPKQHQNLLRKYAFVASPQGNGIDTHRTWEAFYFKCVPIVLRSFMSEHYEHIKLPVWVIDSYDELNGLDENLLRNKYESLVDRFDSPAIWADYWITRIQESSIKICEEQ